jgi:chromosome segregation ATPase
MDEKDRMIQEMRADVEKLKAEKLELERLVQTRNGEKAVLTERVKHLEWKNRMMEMKREELAMKVERIQDELTMTRRKLVALVESLEEMSEQSQQGLEAMKKMQEALTLR